MMYSTIVKIFIFSIISNVALGMLIDSTSIQDDCFKFFDLPKLLEQLERWNCQEKLNFGRDHLVLDADWEGDSYLFKPPGQKRIAYFCQCVEKRTEEIPPLSRDDYNGYKDKLNDYNIKYTGTRFKAEFDILVKAIGDLQAAKNMGFSVTLQPDCSIGKLREKFNQYLNGGCDGSKSPAAKRAANRRFIKLFGDQADIEYMNLHESDFDAKDVLQNFMDDIKLRAESALKTDIPPQRVLEKLRPPEKKYQACLPISFWSKIEQFIQLDGLVNFCKQYMDPEDEMEVIADIKEKLQREGKSVNDANIIEELVTSITAPESPAMNWWTGSNHTFKNSLLLDLKSPGAQERVREFIREFYYTDDDYEVIPEAPFKRKKCLKCHPENMKNYLNKQSFNDRFARKTEEYCQELVQGDIISKIMCTPEESLTIHNPNMMLNELQFQNDPFVQDTRFGFEQAYCDEFKKNSTTNTATPMEVIEEIFREDKNAISRKSIKCSNQINCDDFIHNGTFKVNEPLCELLAPTDTSGNHKMKSDEQLAELINDDWIARQNFSSEEVEDAIADIQGYLNYTNPLNTPKQESSIPRCRKDETTGRPGDRSALSGGGSSLGTGAEGRTEAGREDQKEGNDIINSFLRDEDVKEIIKPVPKAGESEGEEAKVKEPQEEESKGPGPQDKDTKITLTKESYAGSHAVSKGKPFAGGKLPRQKAVGNIVGNTEERDARSRTDTNSSSIDPVDRTSNNRVDISSSDNTQDVAEEIINTALDPTGELFGPRVREELRQAANNATTGLGVGVGSDPGLGLLGDPITQEIINAPTSWNVDLKDYDRKNPDATPQQLLKSIIDDTPTGSEKIGIDLEDGTRMELFIDPNGNEIDFLNFAVLKDKEGNILLDENGNPIIKTFEELLASGKFSNNPRAKKLLRALIARRNSITVSENEIHQDSGIVLFYNLLIPISDAYASDTTLDPIFLKKSAKMIVQRHNLDKRNFFFLKVTKLDKKEELLRMRIARSSDDKSIIDIVPLLRNEKLEEDLQKIEAIANPKTIKNLTERIKNVTANGEHAIVINYGQKKVLKPAIVPPKKQ